jgi:hypothetical protein
MPGLDLFASDPGPWVAAAEPAVWRGSDGLRYVKLVDGADVGRVIFESAGRFVPGQGECPVGQECIPMPFAAASAPLGDASRPAPREGHAAVLSSTQSRLWVFGGRSLTDGSELSDAWAYHLASATWERLSPSGVSLGRVLAATYSAEHRVVWILDEDAPSGRGRFRARRLRLLRMEPTGQVAEVVASWPRISNNDDFALTVDPSGALWLAASPTPGAVHVVARLGWTGSGVTIDGWRVGVGHLVPGAARAGDEGLTILVEDHRRGAEPIAYRPADLWRRRGGERACF